MKTKLNSNLLILLLLLGEILFCHSLTAQNKNISTKDITDFEKIQKTLPKGLYLLNEKGFENIVQIETSYSALKEKFSIVEIELNNVKAEVLPLKVKNSQLEANNKVLLENVERLSKSNTFLKVGVSVSTIICIIKALN